MRSAALRPALWVTLRGASLWVGVLWMAWVGLAVWGSPGLAGAAGPAGAAAALFAVGWALARFCPHPNAALTRFHLDDHELTICGPGRRVVRREWGTFVSIRQGRRDLHLDGPQGRVRLPLTGLDRGDAWFTVLGRIVPTAAEGLWETLESGVVTLRPELDPSPGGLCWWAYAPIAAACLAMGDLETAMLVAVVALLERALAMVLRYRGTLALHPGGVVFPHGRRRFVPWSRARIAPDPRGLRVGSDGDAPAVVPMGLPNFWAAAAVIHLRAQVGGDCPERVHFRLRRSNGSVAVVGEIDAAQ